MFSVGPLVEAAICDCGTDRLATAGSSCDVPTSPMLGRAVELQRILRSTEPETVEVPVSTRHAGTTWTETMTTALRLSARAELDARATALMVRSRQTISRRALLVLGLEGTRWNTTKGRAVFVPLPKATARVFQLAVTISDVGIQF